MLNDIIAASKDRLNQMSDALKERRAGDLQGAYAKWKRNQDIEAIMVAFAKLSDRRLEMIGVKRDEIYDLVVELMERADERKSFAREVEALLDAAPEAGVQPNVQPAPADAAREDAKATMAA